MLAGGLAALLLASAASDARADAPPPAPPAPEARAVVAAVPRARTAVLRPGRARLEVQAHLATIEPDAEGVLTLDSGTPGQARWDEASYGEEVAGRVLLTWPGSGGEVALAGTWWGSWRDETLTAGTLASRATPADPLNVTSTTGIGLRTVASLWDARVGFLRPSCPAPCLEVAWGGGVRYLHLSEEASFLFPTTVPPENAAVFTADLSSGLFAVEATVRATWRFAPGLSLALTGSVLGGWMRRTGRLATTNVTPPPALAGDHDDQFGYGAEVEASVRWHVSRTWSLTAGYGVLVLGPVARAFEAYDFSNVATSDLGPVFTDDTLLVQRLFVGLALDL